MQVVDGLQQYHIREIQRDQKIEQRDGHLRVKCDTCGVVLPRTFLTYWGPECSRCEEGRLKPVEEAGA